MSDLRKQWAVVQRRVPPLSPAETRRIHEACLSLGITGYALDVAWAELVAALPRPVVVRKQRPPFALPGETVWTHHCRLCGVPLIWLTDRGYYPTHPEALCAGLRHLYDAHGCPNRRTTGEPCDTACIHCHGWQWCAQPNERGDW